MTSIAAIWPALLGVFAAHQIAYTGHDDGHIHGYLETVGPVLVVAAMLGWLHARAHARVEFRSVLLLQAFLFGVMEGAERIAATSAFAISDLAPVGIALVLMPMVAGLVVLADGVMDALGATRWNAVAGRLDSSAGSPASSVAQPLLCGTWSIRAPPSRV